MNLIFDIGGTNMRVATSDGNTLGQTLKVGTPVDFDDGMKALAELTEKLLHGNKPELICCGIAGSFNAEKSEIVRWHNLPTWEKQWR